MPEKPGRPAKQAGQDAFSAIVHSACLCFARHGIKGTTVKQIAEPAKVTPAMVHYYFRDKKGLYLAVLQEAFDPLLEKLSKVKNLEQWVHIFHDNLMQKPWLPHMMLREVLPHDGQLRALFMQEYAPKIYGRISAAIKQELDAQPHRRKLDTDRHAMLLMGMLVYPFLGLEVAQKVSGRTFDARMLTGFRDDALNLFRAGIAAQ